MEDERLVEMNQESVSIRASGLIYGISESMMSRHVSATHEVHLS